MTSEKHNALTNEFILKIGGTCKDHAELMTVLESIVLGCMMLNKNLFGCSSKVAAGLTELTLQRAMERFAEDNKL